MILVIGATGFIGSNLLLKLAKDGIYPIATYRKNSNKDKIASLFIDDKSGIPVVFHSISDRVSIK